MHTVNAAGFWTLLYCISSCWAFANADFLSLSLIHKHTHTRLSRIRWAVRHTVWGLAFGLGDWGADGLSLGTNTAAGGNISGATGRNVTRGHLGRTLPEANVSVCFHLVFLSFACHSLEVAVSSGWGFLAGCKAQIEREVDGERNFYVAPPLIFRSEICFI